MKQFMRRYFIFFSILTSIMALLAYTIYVEKQKPLPADDALSRIMRTGKIRMLTNNNANCYYIYRGEPMGFEYELAREFADFLQVDLEVVIPGWSNLFGYLDLSYGDFIAASITITEPREQNMLFCPYMDIQQMFIHHKNKIPLSGINRLHKRALHITRNTSYHERLLEIQESGIAVDMVVHEDLSTEELLRMISDKEISYTIADSNIALLNRRYYPDIRISIPIQEKQRLGWAVHPSDTALLHEIEMFFYTIKNNGVYERIYNKYYDYVEEFDYFDLVKFHERLDTRLPTYQDIIMKESEKYGFDWRMVAALIYQESHFDPQARSSTGVRGLMQVTEGTASYMKINNRRDPIQSLKAGIGYLDKLHKKFVYIEDPLDRIKLAMASYNIGYGHVLDAQRLARRQGMDANKWASIEKTLPLLAKSKYHRTLKYGYARGGEPVKYIERIFIYYDILKQKAHVGG